MNYYPLLLESVLKNIIWGGNKLSEEYGKGTFGEKIAEAWTLALRCDGVNRIANGEYSGMMLDVYSKLCGMESLCGHGASNRDFPLLVKLIDAENSLSVQVHPDDAYALRHGLDAGKTEAWYIVDAKPGAKIVYGLKPGVAYEPQKFKEAALSGNLEEYLNYVEVKKGDIYYIPAGLVHAIGAGILIAEVQQNSNTTFRIYDYNRVDANGNKRELHIDSALEAIKPDALKGESFEGKYEDEQYRELINAKYFEIGCLTLSPNDGRGFDSGKMYHLICTDGCASVLFDAKEYPMKKGDAYLIPAAMGYFTVFSEKGAEIITASPKI